MNIDKLFKFKAKVLKKELGVNQANANELLSKLIGFSNYYEYKKNVDSVDGRLEYLRISKSTPTLSNKRIEKITQRADDLGVGDDVILKLFSVKNKEDLIANDKEIGLIDFFVDLYKENFLPETGMALNAIQYPTGCLFRQRLLKSLSLKSNNCLIVDNKIMEKSDCGHYVSCDFLSINKFKIDIKNRRDFSTEYDLIIIYVRDLGLLKNKDFFEKNKDKNIIIFYDLVKVMTSDKWRDTISQIKKEFKIHGKNFVLQPKLLTEIELKKMIFDDKVLIKKDYHISESLIHSVEPISAISRKLDLKDKQEVFTKNGFIVRFN